MIFPVLSKNSDGFNVAPYVDIDPALLSPAPVASPGDAKPCGHTSSVTCGTCGTAMQEHYVHEVAELYFCSKCCAVKLGDPNGVTEYVLKNTPANPGVDVDRAFKDYEYARENLLQLAVQYEYIADAPFPLPSSNELAKSLQTMELLACAVTNQDGHFKTTSEPTPVNEPLTEAANRQSQDEAACNELCAMIDGDTPAQCVDILQRERAHNTAEIKRLNALAVTIEAQRMKLRDELCASRAEVVILSDSKKKPEADTASILLALAELRRDHGTMTKNLMLEINAKVERSTDLSRAALLLFDCRKEIQTHYNNPPSGVSARRLLTVIDAFLQALQTKGVHPCVSFS